MARADQLQSRHFKEVIATPRIDAMQESPKVVRVILSAEKILR